MGPGEFFNEYFVKPQLGAGYATYNPYNTIAYALVALAAAFLIFKALKKLGVAVDGGLARAALPFIFFGSFARVLVDAGVLPRKVAVLGSELNPVLYPFVTPGIYVLTFLLLAAAYAVARIALKENKRALAAVERTGWVLAALSLGRLLLLPAFFTNTWALAGIIALAALPLLAYELACRVKLLIRTQFNSLAVAGQALDGAATFVGVSFLGYSEQHVVGNLIFALGSPLLFYAVKAAFAFAVVYAADRENDSAEKNYVLLLIAILGLGPGMRDATRILAGV